MAIQNGRKIKGRLLWVMATLSVLTFKGCRQEKPATREHNSRPNIVYIMADDHAFQAISAYGSPISKLAPTPNIDRLANEGILFKKAFVENSLCTPSRACLLTGLYSHQNGQRQLNEGIDTTKVFFTELLQKAGYQTAVVGKWHLICEPKGFDSYHILRNQGEYYNPVFKSETSNGAYVREDGYASTLITNHALTFLENRAKDKPFCLLVHHKAPHRNWMPDSRYLDLYEDVDFPMPETFNDDYKTRCSAATTQAMTIRSVMEMVNDLKLDELKDTPPYDKEGLGHGLSSELERMTPEQRKAWKDAYGPRNKAFLDKRLKGDDLVRWKYQRYIKDYLRCIKSVDDEVGRITAYLEKEGLLDNTLIVYTSDQGFYLGEHGWFDKRFMYDESLRTPLIMRYPNAVRAGTISEAMVQNIDFAPTFLSLAGIEKPKEMSGMTVEPLFEGTPPAWRTSLYYHYYDYPTVHNVRRHDGVRTDRYKLIHFYGKGGMEGATNPLQHNEATLEYKFLQQYATAGKMGNDPDIDCNELYDLQTDPHELHNLYGKPGTEKITAELQGLLDNYRRDLKVGEF